MPALNPQDVIAEGKCYACYGMSLADLIKLTLISNIDASEEPDEFDPADVAGLTVWLDAMTLPVVADGTQIQNWPDLSGMGNHFSQAILLNRPRYFSAGVIGLPAVRFNGSNGYMDTIALSSAILTTSAYTIFVVSSNSSFATSSPGATPWNNQTLLGTTGGYQGIVFTSGAGGQVWGWVYDGAPRVAEAIGSVGAHIFTSRLDAGVLHMEQDTSGEGTEPSGNVGSLANTMRIGSNYLLAAFLPGDIMEVLIYNNVVSGANRLLIYSYLSAKWFA